MKDKVEIIGKLKQLVNIDRVGSSDNYVHNIQGMIEALFWVIEEDVDDKLRQEVESII